MIILGSNLLTHVAAAIYSRGDQTYEQRKHEIVRVAEEVMGVNYTPSFVMVPLNGRIITMPISQVAWDALKKDAGNLYIAIHDAEGMRYKDDVYNIYACDL
jgi:hypothetical protein